jgi:hypothetical protein
VLIKDILRDLNLGSSVAENDEALEAYFVETATFRELLEGRHDTVAGDKGTGKTALYRILQKRAAASLRDVEVIAGFNPVGTPVFQRLTEGDPLEEGQYITIWKAYVLSLAGNWVLALADEREYSAKMKELDRLLKEGDLRSPDDSATAVFAQIANHVRRFMRPSKAGVALTITPNGWPIVVPHVEFAEATTQEERVIPHDRALRLLNDVLGEVDFSVWIVLDRLDEAFQGFPQSEVPALRALLRTYLDLAEFDRVTLKPFVRKDLFRRIIGDGFVNLTHVNDRKVEITWDVEDLFDLLCRRFRENGRFIEALDLPKDVSNDVLFARVFPPQVDLGKNRPTTWNWMLTRIRDGNGIMPPRNLIDLVKKAQDAQMRKEERGAAEFNPAGGIGLIQSDAIKKGLGMLSAERVQDTLLAEAGEYAPLIDRFRDGRAEHNLDSLATTLKIDRPAVRSTIQPLIDLGFLEPTGETFKVPMLYRGGLSITQGKAFAQHGPDDEDEDET